MASGPTSASDIYIQTPDGLDDSGTAHPAMLVGPDRSQIELTPSTYALFEKILQQLQQGRGVQLVVYDRDLSTQQAADILNVSRQYLVRLLENQEIPFHKVGTHRRVRLTDVLDYREQRHRSQRESLARLTQASQDMGDYD